MALHSRDHLPSPAKKRKVEEPWSQSSAYQKYRATTFDRTLATSDEPTTADHSNVHATPAAFLPQSRLCQSLYHIPTAEAQRQKEAAVMDQFSTSALPAHSNRRPIAMPDYTSFVQHYVDDAVYNQHHEDHTVFIQHPPDEAAIIQHPPYDANSMHTHHAPTFLYRGHEQATYDKDPYIHNCQ